MLKAKQMSKVKIIFSNYLFLIPVTLIIVNILILLRIMSFKESLNLLKKKIKYIRKLKNKLTAAQLVKLTRAVNSFFLSKKCLYSSIASYIILNSLGYKVNFVIGCFKDKKSLSSHSWVMVNNKAVCENINLNKYSEIIRI